jgi:nitrogen fixation-related uncharacterized protein
MRMKRVTILLAAIVVGVFVWGLKAQAAPDLTPAEQAELDRNRAMAQEAISFQSAAAEQCRNPGSPIKPPKKVTMCHKPEQHGGTTIAVPEPAVPAHLAHGDYLGPCH